MSAASDPGKPVLSKAMLKLARQLDSTASADYVAVEPVADCEPGQCFQNVRAHVRRHGGSVQHGWRLREQPSVFVEGEFHAVWRRPEGAMVDVTPRTDGLDVILFLPDSRMVWDGQDVESRRVMLHEQPCYCGSRMPFNLCHGLAED